MRATFMYVLYYFIYCFFDVFLWFSFQKNIFFTEEIREAILLYVFKKKHFEMEKKFLGNPIYTKYVYIQVQNLNFVKYFKN